jgi:hypothetical protein
MNGVTIKTAIARLNNGERRFLMSDVGVGVPFY